MTAVSILVGLLAAGGTIAALVIARKRAPSSPRTARPGRIDAFAVGEPWRRHVAAAQSAQRRFAAMVATISPGPLRDRMVEIGRKVDRGVQECWEIARRGDQLDETIRHLAGASVQARFDRATDPVEKASLESQLAAIDRIRTSRNQTDERLKVLQTRLGELVTQAAEVSTGVDHTSELGSAVEEIVEQLEGLRLAFRDLNGTTGSGTAVDDAPT